MTENRNIYLVGGIVLLFLSQLLTWYFVFFQRSKVVYVNTTSVYTKFKMKVELEEDYKKIINKRMYVIDSLRNRFIDPNLSVGDKQNISMRLRVLEEQFDEESQRTQLDFDKKIWLRLNEYIKEYGENLNYPIILGATGNGSLMHGSEKLDVSDDFVEFANQRYLDDSVAR